MWAFPAVDYFCFYQLIYIQPGLPFSAGWLLFAPIAVFNQFDSVKWNWSILGNLISKWKGLWSGVELQYMAVPQLWLNVPGFLELNWSFIPSPVPGRWFFRTWKEAAAVAGEQGGEVCWSISSFMNLALLYLSLPCTVPRLVLEESCKNEEVKGNIVIVYCYLLLLHSPLWIFTTRICQLH